ncbi:MAG TPA: carotenoid biosynthesis protein [Methylomirabilota bacterium]|nr:carotenoid biosynthesis protein [Methylomirabilota bacterium]
MNFIPWIFLVLQAAIVVGSLLGYGIFTARPDLLVQVDPQAKFFVWAFHGFAVGNMLFGALAVAAEALIRNRRRALAALVVVYAVSLASELLGTTYGIPFGPYSYTALLGPKWFERVPLLIPLSWFTMSWAVWVMARRWTNRWAAVLLGTALLCAWDLLLDPAMSRVTSYWVWGEVGHYYGMPWSNLAGWAITGLVLLVLLHQLAPRPQSTFGFATWVYLVNFSLPLGFCLLNRYWLAVFASLGTAAVAWLGFSGAVVKYRAQTKAAATFSAKTDAA